MPGGSTLCTTDAAEGNRMAWLQLLILIVLVVTLPGCAVVGGIFKAGAFVGALAVILVIAIVGIIAAKVIG